MVLLLGALHRLALWRVAVRSGAWWMGQWMGRKQQQQGSKVALGWPLLWLAAGLPHGVKQHFVLCRLAWWQ
jgi:hypothetical protein